MPAALRANRPRCCDARAASGNTDEYMDGKPLPNFFVYRKPWYRDPLTWEAEASQADYSGIGSLCDEYERRKVAAPHTWHAAEAFLYLLEDL